MIEKILGVDFGDTRTGLALSDALGLTASPAGCINSTYMVQTAKLVAQAAADNNVSKIVVGLPVNMNGTMGSRCEHVKEFAEHLKEHLEKDIPIEFFDERMSTMAAHQILNLTDTRGKKRKQVVDILSAQIILQNYLDSHR